MKRVSGSDKYNPCLLSFIVKAVFIPIINSQQCWGLQSCPDFPLKMYLFEQKKKNNVLDQQASGGSGA